MNLDYLKKLKKNDLQYERKEFLKLLNERDKRYLDTIEYSILSKQIDDFKTRIRNSYPRDKAKLILKRTVGLEELQLLELMA